MLHWDRELKGFGVLCSGTTGSKSFIVQRHLPGSKSPRRVTVASAAEIGLKEARERAAELLLGMRRGIDPKAPRSGQAGTLGSMLERYLRGRNSLSARSRENYRSRVEGYLGPWLHRPLREITPDMVEDRHRQIKAEIESAGRHAGDATANAVMVALRTIWNYAADLDPSLPANPVRRLKRQWFSVHRRERHVASKDLPKFYAGVLALANPVARDYLLLLLFTGLRRREAAGLRWDHIDLAEGVIRIPAAATKTRQKLDLPMTDVVRDLLAARRAVGKEEYVFPADSRSGHIEEPRHPLDLVAEATGIRVSAHDLRRTFITAAESADISPMALKALVNHSLGGDVTAGYVQMTTERLREPAQRVADRLKKLCNDDGMSLYCRATEV